MTSYAEASSTPVHAGFDAINACWVCESAALTSVHEAILDFAAFASQDAELARYTGSRVPLLRCGQCGFSQPAALPRLARFFDRMYDQRWSDDWIEREFESTYKDRIFDAILDELARRVRPTDARLLDIGAHVGRFLWLAGQRGWQPEGIELNPRTAAFAARRTGLTIHQRDVRAVRADTRAFDAVTLTDVLEHIPDPRMALEEIAPAIRPGGWIAIKVPNGPVQLMKERLKGILRPGYRPTVADNLVHVNHFTPHSLELLLRACGFDEVSVIAAPPEDPGDQGTLGHATQRARRLARTATYGATRHLPSAIQGRLALHIQAYARRV